MPTQCIAEQFDFGTVEGRAVEAAFDAGLVTSDAGALLLRATDRAIGLMDRFAACFHDERRRKLDVIDGTTGEVLTAQLFVAALGASSYTWAEATWTQGLGDWIGSHTRTFAFIGAVPAMVVSDNLKAGVANADHIGSWLEVLREDNRAIIRAASAASKAADYVLASDHTALAAVPSAA